MNAYLYLSIAAVLSFVVAVEGNDKEPYLELIKQVQQLKGLVKNLSTRLQNAEKAKVVLAERLANTIAQMRSKHENLPAIKRAFTDSQVAFYASLRHSVRALSVHETVVFDDLSTTTSPDLYNTVNGVFIAPVSGMYVFSWTQNVDHKDYQSTELVVDSTPVAWAYADTAGDDNEDDYGSSSQTVVVVVKQGMHVFIRTGAQGKGVMHGEDYSTFSGFLLFKIS